MKSAALRLVKDEDLEPVEVPVVRQDKEPDLDSKFDFSSAYMQYELGIRTLWVEVIRRAAFDWVLYKNSRKMPKRQLAQDAFFWLFVEGPSSPSWNERIESDGSNITSFIGICEALGLDPDTLRSGICRLTATKIKTLGRLPMRRIRRDSSTEPGHDDLEMRMECAARAVSFIQEVRFGGELSDSDELDVSW